MLSRIVSVSLLSLAALAYPGIARADDGTPAADRPSSSAAAPSSRMRPRSFSLYAGSAAASVLDTSAGAVPALGGALTATIPLGRLFALELVGSAGVSAARAEEPNNAWLRLALGLRIERTDVWGFRPYGALRLVHLHFAPTQTWSDHPGASILGDSSHGLDHRSGLGLAGGFSHGLGDTPFRVFAELEPSWVPIGRGPKFFAATTFGLGVAL